jgi:WD40 repeat protein
MLNLLERQAGGPEFRFQPVVVSRRDLKRRLEYVGFSATQRKIYLSRQYNIEIYALDGTFEKELETGGGCTKYPISLVTGILDDRLVLYGDTDGTLYRLDPGSGQCHSLARKPGRILIKFDTNAAGDLGAMVFKDRTAAFITLGEDMSSRSLIYLPNNKVVTAIFRPGSDDQLLTAGEDGRVALWQLDDGVPREIRFYRPSGTAIGFAAYTEDGSRIVAVDNVGDLRVWDADTGALVEERVFTVRR